MAKRAYPRARKSVKVPLHAVVHLLSQVHEMGHSEQLQAHLKDNDASLTLNPITVNVVKDYLASNNLHQNNTAAAAAVHSIDPFDCPTVDS